MIVRPARCFTYTWSRVPLPTSSPGHRARPPLALGPQLSDWSRVIASRRAGQLISGVMIAVASLALLGWLADVAWLVQPIPTFVPWHLASVLGMFALGVGLFSASSRGPRAVTVVCALLAIVFGTTSLQHALGINALWSLLGNVTPPQATRWFGHSPVIAFPSAVFVTLGAIGLLALVFRTRGVRLSMVLAAAGSVVMVMATTVILAQLMGLLQGVVYGSLLGSSVQATVLALAFATHYSAMAWTGKAEFAPPPAWLPVSVGIGSLAAVLLVWRALLMNEEAQLDERSRVAARATRFAVTRQLRVAERSLRRISQQRAAPDSMWNAVATQLVNDVSGLESIVWTDASARPLGGDTRTRDTALRGIVRTLEPRTGELLSPTTQAAVIALRGDASRALMIVPRCSNARCSDLIVGVITAPALLGAIITDTVLGFELAIGSGGRWFRGSALPPAAKSRYLAVEPVVVHGPDWQVAAWPSTRTGASTPSTLSDFVLLLGLAVSALLAIALRLAQMVSRTARLGERAALDRALQFTADGLWEWDLQTGLVTRSPQLWGRLGYGNGHQYRGMTEWLTLVHPQDRAMVEQRLNDHLSSAADAFDAQYRVRSAAGRWHDFMDRGRVVLRSPTGEPLRLLGMFADVTDRRHAEELVRQAETMSTMGRLAARIAHEINNPLAGIQSAFLLIKDAIPPTHPHIKYVGAIEREVQRISQVTRQLYETYRPETESSTHAPVQTVVGDAVAFLEQVNRNAGVTIDVELGGIAAVVRLSDSMLRQCIYNLVQNAIEASPAGSRVTVSGSIQGQEFVLRVRDRGPGVPMELRESIFDPFVSTKPSQLSTGGMGLGLSIVRRAVDAAGGSIEVTDAEGGGAEFIARIPLVETPLHGVSA